MAVTTLNDRSTPTNDHSEAREVWTLAVAWYLRPERPTEKRAKQAAIVDAIKCELSSVRSVATLHDLYSRDAHWCRQIGHRLFPGEWSTLGIHAATAVAFGLRYVELVTGETLRVFEPSNHWLDTLADQ